MFPRRETRSLDIRRQSFDKLDRRRSADMCRSIRRYDEYWGAAEKSDTRLKCGDGIIHHVHSQMCILWSPVLRDMINLYPTPALLESTHGLAYLLVVEEDSQTWAAVLDMMYPVIKPTAMDWELLERCLVLADKYDMSCLLQRITALVLEPSTTFSIDPSHPNFALRWLSLSERLQLPEVAARVIEYLKLGLSDLGSRPDAMAAVLAYAHEHLSKEQLLNLLQISMQAQQQQQHGFMQLSQQQQQQQQQQAFVHVQQLQQPQTISMALQGWLGQANSSNSQGHSQQQHQQQSWDLPPVPLFDQQQQQQQPLQRDVSSSCSGTSSPAPARDEFTSGTSDQEEADSKQTSAAADVALTTEQQRLALCMSSGLFAQAPLPQRPTVSAPAAAPVSGFVSQAAQVQAASKAVACPIPRFPSGQGSFGMGRQQQPQPQQVLALGAQADSCALSFGFGVNGGSTSIADWMRNQPEGMILS